MGLWTISWALVPGPEGAGPWMLCAAEPGERAWLAVREKGAVGMCQPCTIIASQLCLFRRAGSLDCYVKKKLTTMFTQRCPGFLLQPLALTVLSAQGEKQ